MKLKLILALMSIGLFLVSPSAAKEPDDQIKDDLNSTLKIFVKKYELKPADLSAMLISFIMENEKTADENLIPADDIKMKADLDTTLQSFADKHSITMNNLMEKLGSIALDGEGMAKGGIGVINKTCYISLRDKENVLTISGRRWEGKKSSEQQIVFINENKVFENVNNKDLSKTTIVIFTEKEVRFIDLSTFTGGKYRRQP